MRGKIEDGNRRPLYCEINYTHRLNMQRTVLFPRHLSASRNLGNLIFYCVEVKMTPADVFEVRTPAKP